MKNTKYILASIFLICLVLPLVNAAGPIATVISPTTATWYSTTMLVNCTTDMSNSTSVKFFYSTTNGTVFAATSVFKTITNTSTDQTTYFATVSNLSSYTDDESISVMCSVNNASGLEVNSTPIHTVKIDSTNPTAVLSTTKLNYAPSSMLTAVCDQSTDAMDSSLTYLITLTKPNAVSTTSTDSKTTFSGTALSMVGMYSLTCTVTDDASNTNTATISNIKVTDTEDTTAAQQAVTATGEKTTNLNLIIICVVVVIIVIVVVIMSAENGKRRKRR